MPTAIRSAKSQDLALPMEALAMLDLEKIREVAFSLLKLGKADKAWTLLEGLNRFDMAGDIVFSLTGDVAFNHLEGRKGADFAKRTMAEFGRLAGSALARAAKLSAKGKNAPFLVKGERTMSTSQPTPRPLGGDCPAGELAKITKERGPRGVHDDDAGRLAFAAGAREAAGLEAMDLAINHGSMEPSGWNGLVDDRIESHASTHRAYPELIERAIDREAACLKSQLAAKKPKAGSKAKAAPALQFDPAALVPILALGEPALLACALKAWAKHGADVGALLTAEGGFPKVDAQWEACAVDAALANKDIEMGRMMARAAPGIDFAAIASKLSEAHREAAENTRRYNSAEKARPKFALADSILAMGEALAISASTPEPAGKPRAPKVRL